jgi:hypothetical protein
VKVAKATQEATDATKMHIEEQLAEIMREDCVTKVTQDYIDKLRRDAAEKRRVARKKLCVPDVETATPVKTKKRLAFAGTEEIKSKKPRVRVPAAVETIAPVETVAPETLDEIAARLEAERSPSPPPPAVYRPPSVDPREARSYAQHSFEAGSPSLGLADVADFLSEDAPPTSRELITEAYHHHILMRIRRRIEEIGGVAHPDGSMLNPRTRTFASWT